MKKVALICMLSFLMCFTSALVVSAETVETYIETTTETEVLLDGLTIVTTTTVTTVITDGISEVTTTFNVEEFQSNVTTTPIVEPTPTKNPVVTPRPTVKPTRTPKPTPTVKVYTTKATASAAILKGLLAHEKTIEMVVSSSVAENNSEARELLTGAYAVNKNSSSKAGDYIRWNIDHWSTQYQTEGLTTKLTLNIVYRTSVAQEKKLDTAIKATLEKLNISKLSDYKKVKAIHDYIINRASYDTTYTNYTAYNTLINKSAVCQGYALLAYRMFNEAGIPCRLIVGQANGYHAWNIVKVSGKWYNIDLTWDDPITYNGKPMLSYTYFLKNNAAFSDHFRDTEYSTKDFVKAYPIAKTSLK